MGVETFPSNGEKIIYFNPQEDIDLQGVNIDQLQIDIIGSDFIFTNKATGGRILVSDLGLYIFANDEAGILINGEKFTGNDILSHVGVVQNVTQDDFLTFTSLKINETIAAEGNQMANQGDAEEDAEEQSSKAEMEAMLFDIASFKAPPGQILIQEENDNTSKLTETEKSRAEITEKNPGRYDEPPAKKASASASKKSDFTEEKTEDNTEVDTGQIDSDAAVKSFSISAGFVQKISSSGMEDISGTDTFVYRGGGGSLTSQISTNKFLQYSTDVIDLSDRADAHIVYADNPDNFSDIKMSRELLLSPELADGFEISQLVIGGFPGTFTLPGHTASGGVYTLNSPVVDDNGDIRLLIEYPVGSADSFELNIEAVASFDPDSGFATPSTLSFSDTITRNVEVREVDDINDYNDTDDDGNEMWILANSPNANSIFSGSGNATVYGNSANDTIITFDGGDYVDPGAGVNVVRTNVGDDYIVSGLGSNTIDGGLGTDTVDYSAYSGNIDANLNIFNIGTQINLFGNTWKKLDFSYNVTADTYISFDFRKTQSGEIHAIGFDNNDDFNQNEMIVLDGVDWGITHQYSGGGDWQTFTVNIGAYKTGQLPYLFFVNDDDADPNNVESSFRNIKVYEDGADIFDVDVLLLEESLISSYGNGQDIVGAFSITEFAAEDYLEINLGDNTDYIKGIENLIGGSGNDTLTGTAANNTIIGGAGNDTIAGGVGNDILQGGDGSDTISYAYSNFGITLDLTNTDGNGDITVNVSGGDVDRIRAFENIIGSSKDDTLTGDSSYNYINGGGGNDTLKSNGGNDRLDGGGGNDRIDYRGVFDGALNLDLSVKDGSGYSTANFGGGYYEYLRSIENIRGTYGDDIMIGDDDYNEFDGSTGSDYFDGGGGSDNLNFSTLGEGIALDLVNGTAIGINSGDVNTFINFENFILTSHDDTIVSTTDNDSVYTRGGRDYVYASAGDDYFDSSSWDSVIDYSASANGITSTWNSGSNLTKTITGWGTDTIVRIQSIIGTNFDDTVEFSNEIRTEYFDGGGGYNTAYYGNSRAIDVNMTDLNGDGYFRITVTNHDNSNSTHTDYMKNISELRMTNQGDTFRGDAGNNYVLGRNGSDMFYYSLGNDKYDGGNDTDTLSYAGLANDLTIDMTSLDGDGFVTINLGGSAKFDLAKGIDTWILGSGDDDFTGSTGNNVVQASAGADNIATGGGNDTIYAGNDDGSNDNFDGGGGTDWLSYSHDSIGVTVNAGTGQATGIAAGTDTFTGIEHFELGAGDDVFYGNINNQIVNGLGGSDMFYSSDGNDTYNGGGSGVNGTDTINYSGEGAGISVNMAAQTVTKGAGTDGYSDIEAIVGTGSDDQFSLNSSAQLMSFDNIDAGSGTDTVTINNQVTFDGADLDSIFDNIEEIDFSGASLAGGDDFDMTGDHVKGLTDGNDYLHLTIGAGFSMNITGGSYAVASNTVGDTTTYTFTAGMDTVVMDVQTV